MSFFFFFSKAPKSEVILQVSRAECNGTGGKAVPLQLKEPPVEQTKPGCGCVYVCVSLLINSSWLNVSFHFWAYASGASRAASVGS